MCMLEKQVNIVVQQRKHLIEVLRDRITSAPTKEEQDRLKTLLWRLTPVN